MVISSVFYTYLCLIFVHIFFKSIRKMSTALKKTHCYRSLMKLCHAATRKAKAKVVISFPNLRDQNLKNQSILTKAVYAKTKPS